MKRFVVMAVMLALFVVADTAGAIWIRMGNGRYYYQVERACQDGFTLSAAYRLQGFGEEPPISLGNYFAYVRTYPFALVWPGNILIDYYVNGMLPDATYPQPSQIVALGSVYVDDRNSFIAILDGQTEYYGTGDIPWSEGNAPPFDGQPHLNVFYAGSDSSPAPIVPYGEFTGNIPVQGGIEDCHLFAPPALIVPGTQNAVAGTPLTIINIGEFSDASYAFDGVNPVFNYSIDWGDGTPSDTGLATLGVVGTPSTSTLGSFDGTHTYEYVGEYTVKVSVDDNDDGVATETFSVEVSGLLPPGLLGPSAGETTTSRRPLFQWSAVSGATRYEIQLGRNNPPQTVVRDDGFTWFLPRYNLNYTTYYWRVRSINASEMTSQWSETRSITIVAPANARPVMNLIPTYPPTLTWNAVSGAMAYQVQLGLDEDLVGSDLWTVSGSAQSVTPAGLTRGQRYYWRVRALFGIGSWGEWSPVETFVTDLQ